MIRRFSSDTAPAFPDVATMQTGIDNTAQCCMQRATEVNVQREETSAPLMNSKIPFKYESQQYPLAHFASQKAKFSHIRLELQ